MSKEIIEKAKAWTQAPFDAETRAQAVKLIEANDKELIDSFYTALDFGTGGLRGIMGCGTNRVNKYTIGQATQGLANYVKAQFPNETCKIAIACDTRNGSRQFTQLCAEILSANGIEVYISPTFKPTPWLSFAVRYYNCNAGIMITASHNPPEYNGYKVYWNDGGQLVPPHDKGVIAEVRKVGFDEIHFEANTELIHHTDEKIDQAYYAKIKGLSLSNEGKKDLKLVFTALHGTSKDMLPEVLKICGFNEPIRVWEQDTPDGNFPTVKSPNPEEAEALSMAMALAEKEDADLVIGTDPDADRVGIGVKNNHGKWVLLNGNQTAAVLIEYLLMQMRGEHKLRKNHFVAKTIVTSDIIFDIADYYGVQKMDCLTGFKWIAKLIADHEGSLEFVGGGEESYGYLIGDFVRDKDAIAAAVMIAEVAAWGKANDISYYEFLRNLWVKYGYYGESLVSITKKGKEGLEEIQKMMSDLRANPPKELAGEKVAYFLDYENAVKMNLIENTTETIDLPKSNVLQFITESGARITARPSGTEPKIKFYFSIKIPISTFDEIEGAQEKCDARIADFKAALNL